MSHPPFQAPFFSIAGRTDGVLGIEVCAGEDRPDFVTRLDLERDPVDALLSLSEEILDDGLAANPNDGLVRVEASKLGRFLGCVPADHLDEIGHLLGDAPGIGNDFDHGAFYRDLVRWLRAQGL